MNIHEYQAKEPCCAEFGVPVPRGKVALHVEEAVAAAKELGGPVWVVKAQIHAGGRGKGASRRRRPAKGRRPGRQIGRGGEALRQGDARHDARHASDRPAWPRSTRVYIEDGSAIERELYLSLLVDRATQRVAFIASTEGGMDIEEVAHETPEKIMTLPDRTGRSAIHAYVGRKIATALKLKGDQAKQCGKARSEPLQRVHRQGHEPSRDQSAGRDQGRQVICLDAKINFDDNALFRHKDIQALRDLDEEDPMEVEASKYDLSYIKLDGTIGCMVNGAGLAMATMDIIKLYGAEPANFLDVGGGATQGEGDGRVQDHRRPIRT